jgi:predicted nucleic acid-binding protein
MHNLPTKVVIDTNVLAVANGHADHLGDVESLLCQRFLTIVARSAVTHVDSRNLIFEEYFRYARRSGQPTVADAFAKRLWDRQWDARVCRIVTITPTDTSATNFQELSKVTFATRLDPADRKFLAVAWAARPEVPTICNASDSDWQEIQAELLDAGFELMDVLST